MADVDTGARRPLEAAHDPYFVQRVPVHAELARVPRLEVFRRILAGRRVLHVGCADWPITDVRSNLHVQLDPVCARLDGVDPHAQATAAIRPFVRGELYTSLREVSASYDVVLVPEVLEHVGNPEGFLAELDAIDAPEVLITVPDAYSCRGFFDYLPGEKTFVEVVHPDHNCWFTPYTLVNTIRKYTPWTVESVWFINAISLMAVASRRARRDPPRDLGPFGQ
ncbi:MAG TPA: hypothetical protein VKV23_08280 [Acidimicrobiales bacterium]|nr:hypothetical protein [Acidimicrobiales bacterium]